MPVYNLEHLDQTNLERAGGKGANLGELIGAGFPVPPAFVVGAEEYAEFILPCEIPANIDWPSHSEALLQAVRQHLFEAPLPETLVLELNRAESELPALSALPALSEAEAHEKVYAVRSSATAEDLAGASFAGQHDTYYYVTREKLPLMLRKCWASLWSDAAFSYREAQGIEHRSVAMAVVIQQMIPSEVSGVTFTADPVTGDDTVIVTEASWGMGAAIVDGRVSPDQFRVNKKTGKREAARIADKKFMVASTIQADEAPRLIPVPANLRRQASLKEAHIRDISSLAMRCEAHFGSAQDIEWAMANDKIYLLQSRPITVKGPAEFETPEGRYILFKPVAENFTDPLMPLTEDLLAPMIPMMKVINGRIYLNFDHVKALVPLKLSDDDLARLAYLSTPAEQNPGLSLPRFLMLMVIIYGNYLAMGVFARRCADMPDDFMASFRKRATMIAEDDTIDPPATFIHLFARFRFFEPVGNMVMLVNLVAPRYMLMLRLLERILVKWAPALPTDTASLLCTGTEGVLSTQMGRDILSLARTAADCDAVRQTVKNESPGQVLALLQPLPAAQDFLKQFHAFIEMHGHRALKEFELSAPRWEEDPAPVIGMIRNYLLIDTPAQPSSNGSVAQQDELMRSFRQAVAALPLERTLGVRQRIVTFITGQIRYYMKLRENSRFYHIMGFYALRKKLLKIEQQLLDQQRLKCRDDIFYLKWPEILDLLGTQGAWENVEETIRQRRMSHIRKTKMVPPRTVGFELADETTTVDGSDLKGQPASPGVVEGIARVIMDPATDNEIRPGEILVAPYTDPAWTPLFLTAQGAVVEVGSYLSHAGTIAREYGMPCVVDAANCTSVIATGDHIRVDGSKGIVTRLDATSIKSAIEVSPS